jgi:hypothetical protein
MPADPRQTARLRELHQDFAWKVNAAVAAGRADLVDALCEEYADEAVGLITGDPPGEPHPPPAAPPQGRWRSLLTGSRSRPR